jgi:DnaD/phage-associated family protein
MLEKKGFIQLPRTVLQPELWKNPVDFRIYSFLYLSACFKDYNLNNELVIKRGQYLRSFRQLREDLAYIENRQVKYYSLATIHRSVLRLQEDLHLICSKTTELGTLFTIKDYCDSTNLVEKVEELGTQLGTVAKQLRNNNNNVYKNDKEEINEDDDKKPIQKNFYDEFMVAFGKQPTPIQVEYMNQFLDEGISLDLLCYAFKKTALITTNFAYLQSMINNWLKKGIKTISQIEELATPITKGMTIHEADRSSAWKNKFGF